jgi:hypothetical protein
MLILPTFCPDCNEPTMEVVEHEPDDSYEARCTACGCLSLGKISPELLITKRAIESHSLRNSNVWPLHLVAPSGK